MDSRETFKLSNFFRQRIHEFHTRGSPRVKRLRNYSRWKPLEKVTRACFQEYQFRPFRIQTLAYTRCMRSALFYIPAIPKAMLLPGLLIRSRMIHRAHYRGETHTDGTMQISQLRQSWEIVERGSKGAARSCAGSRGKEGLLPRSGAKRGEGGRAESVSWGWEQPRAASAGNMQHECMRGALGNDIGIMVEHGTNEMTNGPTDWNRGPDIGAPSKEGHGVIIQANKGRSRQDYRVPRAAPHPVAPGPLLPVPPLPPCLTVITGPNCSPWHPLLSPGPLPFGERCHPLVSFTSPSSSFTLVLPLRRLSFPPLPFSLSIHVDHPRTRFIDECQPNYTLPICINLSPKLSNNI